LIKMRWLGITKDTFSRDMGQYSWYYDVAELGYKCHMNDIIAAIGLVQLEKLEWMNNRRQEITQIYNSELQNTGDIEFIARKTYQKISAHNYVIKTSRRDELNEYLKQKGISTGVHYYPNHLYEMYKPYYRECPIAEREWKKLITLPLFPDLSNEQIFYIINNIRDFYRTKQL
ncbi:MAG: DegT/DnrJ/EryC1/StrS aminotransferase family protein, partial [Ignavibacteria bacterium]|nr:DegT/DnrJ/EryC1/StrS aminotransferase family protein [Ignavibacteria bacterium]